MKNQSFYPHESWIWVEETVQNNAPNEYIVINYIHNFISFTKKIQGADLDGEEMVKESVSENKVLKLHPEELMNSPYEVENILQ